MLQDEKDFRINKVVTRRADFGDWDFYTRAPRILGSYVVTSPQELSCGIRRYVEWLSSVFLYELFEDGTTRLWVKNKAFSFLRCLSCNSHVFF